MRRVFWLMLLLALAAGASQAQTFTNVKLDDAYVFPGKLIVAQVIEIKTTVTLTVTAVTVKNTAAINKLAGEEIEYLEIRRGSETGQVLKKETTLTNLETTGVTITISANNTFSSGTHRLYILAKLKADAGLVEKKLALGETKINASDVTYPATAPAATFTVKGPTAKFEALGFGDGVVYRGQRFLAARILVDAREVPMDFTIDRLTIQNSATTPLSGRYVARVEVRRADDDALLGEQTTASELEKFTTTGIAVITSANNKVFAYSQTRLEIWITLKPNAPAAQKIQISAKVRCEGTDYTVGEADNAPVFAVRSENLGIEQATSDSTITSKGVVPGQTFLAQRIKLEDDDEDPYDVNLSSILVRNVAASPLADQHISKIEVKRRTDGAVLGSITNLSGLSTGGVRIALTANNVIPDDTVCRH